MSQELYAKPAASVKTASYLVRLRGLLPAEPVSGEDPA